MAQLNCYFRYNVSRSKTDDKRIEFSFERLAKRKQFEHSQDVHADY